MKLLSPPRWAKLSIIGVILLILMVGFRGCGSKKTVAKSDHSAVTTENKLDNNPKSPTTTATVFTLQRIESAITDTQNHIADLAKGLANLNSRVEILEKRLAPRERNRTNKKIITPPVSKSLPPTSSITPVPTTTAPPPAAAVDLTPMVDGLSQIAEAIKEAHTQPPMPVPVESRPPPIIPLISDPDPCASWMQNPVQYRRCRVWNQLS